MNKALAGWVSPLIFLTGLPRSGTTWAGHALAAASGSVLIEEPFNWKFQPAHRPFDSLYLPAGSTDQSLVRAFRRAVFSLKRPRRTVRVLLKRRAIVRDVFVSLAAEQISDQFHAKTIIVVRHPCGVASSWKKLDFKVDYRLERLLSQPALLADYLAPFKAHMQKSQDFFFQMGAYWGAVHHVLLASGARNPDWQWTTHENLCDEGAGAFRKLLESIGSGADPRLAAFLDHTNRKRHPEESPFSVFRQSASEPGKWRNLLKPVEIEAVLEGADPFEALPAFYAP